MTFSNFKTKANFTWQTKMEDNYLLIQLGDKLWSCWRYSSYLTFELPTIYHTKPPTFQKLSYIVIKLFNLFDLSFLDINSAVQEEAATDLRCSVLHRTPLYWHKNPKLGLPGASDSDRFALRWISRYDKLPLLFFINYILHLFFNISLFCR